MAAFETASELKSCRLCQAPQLLRSPSQYLTAGCSLGLAFQSLNVLGTAEARGLPPVAGQKDR